MTGVVRSVDGTEEEGMARHASETATGVLELVVSPDERAPCHSCGVELVTLGALDGTDGELMEYRCLECGEHSLSDAAGADRRASESS